MLIAEVIKIFFALIAVLGMIGLLALAARKAGLASASGGFIRQRRLQLVETLALDGRRRLAIIKCDDKEHLLVLGPTGESVIAHDLETPPAPENTSDPQRAAPVQLTNLLKPFRPAEKDAA